MRIEYLAEDIRAIRQVAGWLYREWGHLSMGTTPETAMRRVAERAGRRAIPLTLVARENGVAIGTASLIAHDMRTRLDITPWVASVYLLPSYRGRGVGVALCRRAVREAHRLGFRRIYLFTDDKADFYKKQAWKEIRQSAYRRKIVTIMASG
jgi:L-amino acid N-acyltransferase YncA